MTEKESGATSLRPASAHKNHLLYATIFGRTVASVHFPRPMPGFYSSSLLLAGSLYLLLELKRTSSGAKGKHRLPFP